MPNSIDIPATAIAFRRILSAWFLYRFSVKKLPAEPVCSNERIKNIYIIKPGETYNLSSPPSIKITTYAVNDKYQDTKDNKKVLVDGSKININYDNKNIEEGYEVIMIPTAYSEEWKLLEGDVKEIISVNGGFIGLIVPKNIASNNITLKFEPKGLKIGSLISLISIVFYLLLILLSILIKRKRKEAIKCQP